MDDYNCRAATRFVASANQTALQKSCQGDRGGAEIALLEFATACRDRPDRMVGTASPRKRCGLVCCSQTTSLLCMSALRTMMRRGCKELWADKVEKPAKAANSSIPRLEIISSPYRKIHQPILDFVNKAKKEKPDRLIAVIIPQLVEPHWYQYLLHDWDASWLRTLLFLERDQRTVVISTPWYSREINGRLKK